MQPNTTLRAPSVQEMSYNTNTGISHQPTPMLVDTARKLSQAVLHQPIEQETPAQKIIAKCHDIDKSMPIIPVAERQALSTFLVQNNVRNPGSLNSHQENLCAWVLLEHASREAPTKKVSATQLRSFIKPENFASVSRIAHQLNVNGSNFKE